MDNRTNSLLPVYLIAGEDSLKRETVLRRLRARMESSGNMEFNFDSFDGETAQGTQIVAACNTVPFAAPARLVAVRHAEKLSKLSMESLVSYCAEPSPTTVLALVAEKLAKNTRLYKAVSAVSPQAVIDCAPKSRRELPRFVKDLGKAYGVHFSDSAAALLVELTGEDAVSLDAQVKKISLSHMGTGPVSDEAVRNAVARTSEAKPWQFIDAFCTRDIARCADLLSRMPTASPYALIAMCMSRIRELICARSLAERGEAGRLAQELKLPDWKVRNHIAWAKNFTPSELAEALCSAVETERAMKSGADPDAVFRLWMLQVLRSVSE